MMTSGVSQPVPLRIPLLSYSKTKPPYSQPPLGPFACPTSATTIVTNSSFASSCALDAPFNPDSKCTFETPTVASSKSTLSTPPEASQGDPPQVIKHDPLPTHQKPFETPKQRVNSHGWAMNYDTSSNHVSTQPLRALLSPAFSSPQQHAVKSFKVAELSPPVCINPSSSLLSLSSDDAQDDHFSQGLKKKKPGKRTKREEREQAFDLCSDEKPPYSYATLIGISILSHKDKQLPLSQIYQWISETFRYYKREDVGWQNSIRHNLSLNKAFVKGEKSKDGKGHFWCIKPGFEEQFLRSRRVKEASYNEVMEHIIRITKQREEQQMPQKELNLPSSPTAIGDLESFSKRETEFEYHNHLSEKRGFEANQEEGIHKRVKSDDCSNESNPAPIETPIQGTQKSGQDTPVLAGKSLAYASSFNCDLNLDLSPIRACGSGPILQPITPSSNAIRKSQHHEPNWLGRSALFPEQMTPGSFPISQPLQLVPFVQGSFPTQNTPKLGISSPYRRTPLDHSMHKIWNSPSYLEEFYYSPFNKATNSIGAGIDGENSPSNTFRTSKLASRLTNDMPHNSDRHNIEALNSYDDDYMVMRSFENHPQQHQTPQRRRA